MVKILYPVFCLFFVSCSAISQETASVEDQRGLQPQDKPASIGLVGDPSDVTTESQLGLVLMGGSRDVDSAITWMLTRSGGGDVVVIRTSGTDAYNDYMFRLGNVNSVETLKIDSRELANDPQTVEAIRNAEMLFIAGGNQATYVENWKDTPTMEAINYLLNEKGVPVGGTSAGCAILGNFYFSGENGSAISAEAIANPYYEKVTVHGENFLNAPFLNRVITDQHFSQRNREGRLVVFMARILQDSGMVVNGIGVDEKTAVCIDEKGYAQVFGQNHAYFLEPSADKKPEIMDAGSVLEWNHDGKAIRTYVMPASPSGNGFFNVKDFSSTDVEGGKYQWWSVMDNELHMIER